MSVTSKDGGLRRFLVKGHGRPDSDVTWILKDDLRIWILRCWIATFPLTFRSRVFFNPKGMIRHGVGPYLGLDEIGSPSPIMIFIIISYLFNCIFWIYLLGFLDLSVRIFYWCL